MEINNELKEEMNNTELITNSRKELLKLLKSFKEKKKKDGRIYCERCIKQDFEIGEYDENDTDKYYDLKLDEDKTNTIVKQTRFGTKYYEKHNHYECPRGHGVCIPGENWMEAPTMKSETIKEKVEKEAKK